MPSSNSFETNPSHQVLITCHTWWVYKTIFHCFSLWFNQWTMIVSSELDRGPTMDTISPWNHVTLVHLIWTPMTTCVRRLCLATMTPSLVIYIHAAQSRIQVWMFHSTSRHAAKWTTVQHEHRLIRLEWPCFHGTDTTNYRLHNRIITTFPGNNCENFFITSLSIVVVYCCLTFKCGTFITAAR